MSETVIVIRSLIPGGPAAVDRRVFPGDRLVYVNDVRLDNASLDAAVQALKGAPYGEVRLGIARPVCEEKEKLLEEEVPRERDDKRCNFATICLSFVLSRVRATLKERRLTLRTARSSISQTTPRKAAILAS